MNRSKYIIDKEVIALFTEGYNTIKRLSFGEMTTTILKHSKNGNTISIYESYHNIKMFKNGKIIKTINLQNE